MSVGIYAPLLSTISENITMMTFLSELPCFKGKTVQNIILNIDTISSTFHLESRYTIISRENKNKQA